MSEETRVRTSTDPKKLARLSYVHVWEPQIDKASKKESFSVSVIISKSDKSTIKAIETAIKAAIEEGNNGGFKGKKLIGKDLAKFESPLKDGDEEKDDEAYSNAYYVNARSNTRPGVVDKDVEDVPFGSDKLYSGCYGRVSMSFYPYNFEGKIGIGVGLNNIQILKGGDPLGSGKPAASDDFEAVEIDDDDMFD